MQLFTGAVSAERRAGVAYGRNEFETPDHQRLAHRLLRVRQPKRHSPGYQSAAARWRKLTLTLNSSIRRAGMRHVTVLLAHLQHDLLHVYNNPFCPDLDSNTEKKKLFI